MRDVIWEKVEWILILLDLNLDIEKIAVKEKKFWLSWTIIFCCMKLDIEIDFYHTSF